MADSPTTPAQDIQSTTEDAGMDVQPSPQQQESHQGRRSGSSSSGHGNGARERSDDGQLLNTNDSNDQSPAQNGTRDSGFVDDGVDDQGFGGYDMDDQGFDDHDLPAQGFDGHNFHDHDDHDDHHLDRNHREHDLHDRAHGQVRRDHARDPRTGGSSRDMNHKRRVNPESPEPMPSHPNKKPKHVPAPIVKKVKKKPGPKPTTKPPITLKDTAAKKALIREIEGHWGKDFIKNYIPKVHRPLTKRKKGKARTYNRKHDDNPNNWLPSVLTCILRLAKKIDDKVRLKKLMGDVVRMRNQHTGNKKPQLVTTDFDVIEDVLDHKWSVAMAFNVRYKHLLNNRLDRNSPTDTKERTEYYKDLFRNSDSDQSESEEEGLDGEDEEYELQTELTDGYQMQSGYYNAGGPVPPPQFNNMNQPPRGFGQQWPMQGHMNAPMHYPNDPRSRQQMQPPPGYGSQGHYQQPMQRGYGSAHPPMDQRRGQGFQDGFGRGQVNQAQRRPVEDYGQPYTRPDNRGGQDRDDFRDPDRRPRLGMPNTTLPTRRGTPIDTPRSGPSRTERYQSVESSPETPLARQRPRGGTLFNTAPPRSVRAPSPLPVIKAEPRDDEGGADHPRETKEADDETGGGGGDGGGGSSDAEEELHAQLALAEATAQAAKLRLQVLSAKSKKRFGGIDRGREGTVTNPMSLD